MNELEMLEKMYGSAAAGLDLMRQVLQIPGEHYVQAMRELDEAYNHLQEAIRKGEAHDEDISDVVE